MPKLPVLSGEKVCQILSQQGFVKIRQRGSHVIMQMKTGSSTVTIPVPNHKELRIGTLQSIIRQSGLPKDIFKT